MKRTKLLIIGFQPFNERMYPHLFDFVSELRKEFSVIYIGTDNRGVPRQCPKFPIFYSSPKKIFGYLKGYIRQRIAHLSSLYWHRFIGVSTVIAIDHQALHDAVKIFPNTIKIVFWSHDYIAVEHEWRKDDKIVQLIQDNIIDIQHVDTIMIQNEKRGKCLDKLLQCDNINKTYFPVSLMDDAYSQITSTQKHDDKILSTIRLSLMSVSTYRDSQRLLSQSIPKDAIWVLRGKVPEEIQKAINIMDYKYELYPFCETYKGMRENLTNCNIGVLSYRLMSDNDLYLSGASGQLVEYLRLGMPVIVFGCDDIGMLVEMHKAGVYIHSEDHLSNAINHIRDNYMAFSENARKLFESNYDMSLYLPDIIKKIDK